MSARHKRAKKRIEQLEDMLLEAANHIESAADVIEGLDDDIDGECDVERAYANMIRRTVLR